MHSDTSTTLEQAISQALSGYTAETDFEVITDIHLHLDADSGTLTLYDDNDMELHHVTIDEWIDTDADECQTIVIPQLSSVLRTMADAHAFDHLSIAKPFSFVLEDDQHETIEELYIVDDDNIYITGDLLAGIDTELDQFFQQLMEE